MRPRRARIVLAALLCLAGCDDPALDDGRSPALVLARPGVVIPLGLLGTSAAIRRGVASLGAGAGAEPMPGDTSIRDPRGAGPQALRARINTASAIRGQQIRAQLLQLGLDPARITIHDSRREQVLLLRTDVAAASCATALRPAWNGDVSGSLGGLGGCIQSQALAGMAADPDDLATPLHLEPGDGSVSAGAIHRLEGAPAQAASAPPSADDAGGGGGVPGPAAAGPAQSAPVVGGNPLLSPAPLPAGPSTE